MTLRFFYFRVFDLESFLGFEVGGGVRFGIEYFTALISCVVLGMFLETCLGFVFCI